MDRKVSAALQSVRTNLVPMLALWVLAVAFVAVYYAVPGGAALFDPLRAWQTEDGWFAAFVNRVIFLALLPGAFMAAVPSIRPKRLGLTVLAYALWGGAWGVFDDRFYPWLASLFGNGTDWRTLTLKTVTGQLVSTVLIGLVPGVLFFRWVAADFSARRVRAEWPEHFFSEACVSLLLANWIVWIPVNVCTYAFPVPLQIQLVGLAGAFWMLVGLAVSRRRLALAAVCALLLVPGASALTIRSQADSRLWQTVFDRSQPLTWTWAEGADAAVVTFVSCDGAVVTQRVVRAGGDADGCGATALPVPSGESLVDVTLVQTTNGVELARDTARLAFVSGANGGPITVRTKSNRAWYRVAEPRLSGYDAAWWQVPGESGYERFWCDKPCSQTVTRSFPGVGVVETVTLRFVLPGSIIYLR